MNEIVYILRGAILSLDQTSAEDHVGWAKFKESNANNKEILAGIKDNYYHQYIPALYQ